MDIFSEEVSLGPLKVDVCVQVRAVSLQNTGESYYVYITAKDEHNRRIWRTPITDGNGRVKYYQSIVNAVDDAKRKLELDTAKQKFEIEETH
jgi:hypothetical protein